LCDLRWDQVEFGAAVLHVRRVKNGAPSTHPLRGDETPGPAPAAAGERVLALRLRQRVGFPVHDSRVRQGWWSARRLRPASS
jgi:hypothetical protein